MMEKILLRSVRKGELRSVFSFNKRWETVDAINDIVIKLGFDEDPEYNLKDLIYGCREPGPKFTIEELSDEVYNIVNEKYSIDVFLGEVKIIMIINSREDKQKEIAEAVFEFAEFEEAKDGN